MTTTWQNTANLLTLGRLASIPLLLLLLAEGAHASAFYLFLAAAASDALDGFLAKRFTGVTAVGAVLDPIADKLLMLSLLTALAQSGTLPVWLLVLTVARDLLIVAGVVWLRAVRPDFKVAPHLLGKLCTFVQLVLAGAALASLAVLPAAGLALPGLIALVTLLTVASGLAYLHAAVRLVWSTPRPASQAQ